MSGFAMFRGLRRAAAGLPLIALLSVSPTAQAAIDHSYADFDKLLSKHVKWNAAGTATAVDYGALKKDRTALTGVLADMTAVKQSEFDQFMEDRAPKASAQTETDESVVKDV